MEDSMSRYRAALAAAYALAGVVVVAFPQIGSGQQPQTREERAASFRQRSIDAERVGLAEPYKGIFTKAGIESGLYAIRSTGVSTEPVVKAAQALLAALSATQRQAATFGVDDIEWRKWMNQDFYVGQGVSFLDMT